MTFPTKTIREVTEVLIDYRGKTPTKTTSGVKLITAKVIKDGFIAEGEHEYIADDDYDEWMRRGLPKQWDILITTEAPLGEVAQLRSPERIALAQRVILLRGNPTVIDQGFYFQALKSPFVQAGLKARSSGTTVLGIKQSELWRVEIPYPTLPIQHRIASILSAYDDLIDNNTRRIKILEEMTRMIYREWFVNFRFPGHEKVRMVESELGMIPEGWNAPSLEQVLEHVIGGGWGEEQQSDEFNVSAYVIRGTDIPPARHGSVTNCPLRWHKESNFKSRRINDGDLVFEVSGGSKGQLVGRSLLVTNTLLSQWDRDVICASFCKLLRPKAEMRLSTALYCFLLEAYTNGTIDKYQVQSTGISNFKFTPFVKEVRMPLPSPAILTRFGEVVTPILDAVAVFGKRNSNLRMTRDLLLPKLVSGEIPVEAAEETVSEVIEASA
jgi:type I restriction enzyme S subunit